MNRSGVHSRSALVRLGPVRIIGGVATDSGTAGMTGNPLPAMEDLNGFFQYNTDTHQITSNIRFNVIHHPLSDLYIVYNDSRDARSGSLVERAFIVKFTNLFNF